MQKVIELRSFRHYQAALLVGDVLLVGAFNWGIVNGIVPVDKAAPAFGMATLWGSNSGVVSGAGEVKGGAYRTPSSFK